MNALRSKFDGPGFTLALLLHAAALAYIWVAPQPKAKRITTVEVDIRKRKPPPPPPPEPPPKPPEPEPPPPEPPKKKLVQRTPKPAQAPKPNQTPPPTTEPPKPVFGIKATDAVGQGISVPVGNTTMADPAKRPKVTEIPPLPAATGVAAGGEYHPIAEEELKRLPEREDEEACAAALKQKWEASETHASGATGQVVLRIELDERGKARTISIVKSMNKEIDNLARSFFKWDPRCRFRPALGKDGKAAAFIIERYTVMFERE